MINYVIKILIIMLVVLPFYLLIRRPWRENTARAWAETAFAAFMVGLLALTFQGRYQRPAAMVRYAAWRIKSVEKINLVPFHTILGRT
ncbi:MAG: hypothetical protein K2O34_13360, partial [Acetatifactor sp.]|nr:hypothetical protein [Acetatifactor sp.]